MSRDAQRKHPSTRATSEQGTTNANLRGRWTNHLDFEHGCLQTSRKAEYRRKHRRASLSNMQHLNHKLETAAETDTVNFWKIVNGRKRGNGTKIGDGLVFNGTVYRSREDIVQQWGQYFADLYTPNSHLKIWFFTPQQLYTHHQFYPAYELGKRIILAEPSSLMYTQMLQSGHIPEKMKKGEIITLHKGGNKR
ncbi:hypothetical protein DPMN_112794 [Dreissena polymorpha]|uniref:Uncharacterized protein n=1 Tax=Dreissena polymorpha TaxID=45954 RepID=A0A9D4KGZ1_DREPO|nr:hypothetical protein DPMN_112794 [Dreissena polymorpha]